MKKLLLRIRAASDGGRFGAPAVIIFAAFIAGAAAGGILAAYGGGGSLSGDVVPELGSVSAPEAVVDVFGYPVAALLCGFAVFGFVLEPLLAGTRGFLVAFAATALMRLYGFPGLLLALASSAVQLIVVLPCFLMSAARGFSVSLAVAGAAAGRYKGVKVLNSIFFLRAAGMALLLSAAVFAEMYLTPWLAGLASGLIGRT